MRRESLTKIRTLAALRDLQRSAIEMRLAKSYADLRQLDARRNESIDGIGDQMQAWEASISGSSVGLDFAQAWSNEIRKGEAALSRIDLQIQDADAGHKALGGELAAASARAKAAEQLRGNAERRQRRRREEVALADFGDRYLHRGFKR